MTILGQMLVEDGIKIGEQNGRIEAILDLLSDYGNPSEELLKKIQSEKDVATLGKWIKLAARAGSIQAFEEQIR